MKQCTQCLEIKPLTGFNKDVRAKDGLRPSCKGCQKVAKKLYREKNREKVRSAQKMYRDKKREEINASAKQYYAENAERINERRRHLNRTDPEFFLKGTYIGMQYRVRGMAEKIAHIYEGLPICSQEEFMAWSLSDNTFKEVWFQWKTSGYEYRLTPSIDRIDNDAGYTLDNMQWLTVSDNTRKRNGDDLRRPEPPATGDE